jgi:hypothetical protein
MNHLLFRIITSCFFLGSILSAQAPVPADSLESPTSPKTLTTDSAQTSYSSSHAPIKWYTFLKNLPSDWSRWGQLSLRQDKVADWAVVAGLTVALVVTDDITYTPSKRFFESSESARYWSDWCAGIGDGRTQFAVAGAFAAYGLVLSDDRALRTGSQVVEAVLASGAVVQVLKHLTGRESPFTRTSPTGIWKLFPNQIDYHKRVPEFDAFPSGHICTSMATVIVIAENYPEVKWIRPVGYVFTTLVGIGMANNGIHWYSDYPLGLFLGYTFGMIVAHPDGFQVGELGKDNSVKMSLSPSVSPQGAGMTLSLSF